MLSLVETRIRGKSSGDGEEGLFATNSGCKERDSGTRRLSTGKSSSNPQEELRWRNDSIMPKHFQKAFMR